MNASELLRKFADLIDQQNGDSENSVAQQPNRAVLTPVEFDNTDNTEVTTMISPLQQKMELLKKSVGLANVYDDEEPDELEIVKRNAGINPAAIQFLSADEPLDD